MAINEPLDQQQPSNVLNELTARMLRDLGGNITTTTYNIDVTVTAPAPGPSHSSGPHPGGNGGNFHRAANDAIRREIAKAAGG